MERGVNDVLRIGRHKQQRTSNTALPLGEKSSMILVMPMNPDDIVSAALRLPPQQVAQIVDRLTLTLDNGFDVEEAWRQESSRRRDEIETGAVQGISGPAVAEEVRRIVGR